MLDWILIAVGIIIVAPILVYLCMKTGTVGFYRGKEVAKRNELIECSVNNDNDKEE